MPFSKAWQAETRRRSAVKYAKAQAKKGKATAHTVKVLQDEARRLEKKLGLKGLERAKSEKQLKRMSPDELARQAQKFQRRAERAERITERRKGRRPTTPTPPSAPPPSAPQDDLQKNLDRWQEGQYSMPDKFGAWDDFKDWLAENGYTFEAGDPMYRKMLEYSREIGDSGMFSQSEQFAMLCHFYETSLDVEDVD